MKGKCNMAKFDPTLDVVHASIEVLIDQNGSVIEHGSTVRDAEKKTGEVRYRFSVASYNGGAPRLRRQTAYTRKRDNELRASACASVPLAHVAILAKIGASLSAQALAALKAA